MPVAVVEVELPRPLPNLHFDALNRVMLHVDGEETLAWDIATGRIPGQHGASGPIR